MKYDADNIKHLDIRTAMRTRIQVYLGSDDTDGIYQSLKEIISNSTDEALAGYGDKIQVELKEGNEISVRDWGRGVPFLKTEDSNVLVSIFTEAHTGGKFDKEVYKSSSGLNGLGGTAVNFSSSMFEVRSYRNGICATAKFKEGILTEYSENKTEEKDGTLINFIPDKKVFKNMTEEFSYERICKEIKNISYLNKGIHFIIKNNNQQKEYYSENGIADFIKEIVHKPLMKNPIIVSKTDGTDEVEIAFMWTGDAAEAYVFVNGLLCPDGGTPITGAKRTLTTSIKRLAKKDFDPELIRRGLVYAINCKVLSPSFANQTKSRINNQNLATLTSAAFKEGLEEFSNTQEFSQIIELMNRYQKAEKAAERARIAVLEHNKEMTQIRKNKLEYFRKLHDAEELGENSTLYVSEGLSSAQALLSGRRTKTEGVMEIKGKMLNTFKAQEDRIMKNEEIKLLLYALGQNIYDFNKKTLRYGKIAIASDQDADGFAIALLIMVVLHTICPQFLRENRLYRLYSPLYIEHDKKGNPIKWWYTDDDYNKDRDKIKGEVARIKGWGGLTDIDLSTTIFSSQGRLDKIIYSEEGIQALQDLMGIDVAPRKEYVFNNIDFSKYGEII